MSSLHEHILVVEDDTQIRNFICFTLEAEAYICHTAATAEEAMRLLAAEPIDLMLLDLGLPDLDGTEVIRRLLSLIHISEPRDGLLSRMPSSA